MSLQVQLVTLGAMVLSGNVLGVVFDAYRVVSREVRLHRFVLSLLDLLYWLAAAVLVFRVLYETNLGEVRLFVFLGLLFGISMYFAFFSRWTILAVRWSIEMFRRLVRFTIKMFDLLIIRPIRFLIRCLIVIWGFLCALSIFLYKFVLQLLYPLWVFLRWIARPLHPMLVNIGGRMPKLVRWLKRAATAVRFWRR